MLKLQDGACSVSTRQVNGKIVPSYFLKITKLEKIGNKKMKDAKKKYSELSLGERKESFRLYLNKNISEESAYRYFKFIEKDVIVDAVKFVSNDKYDNIYQITNSEEAQKIREFVMADPRNNDRHIDGNYSGYTGTACLHYLNFLNDYSKIIENTMNDTAQTDIINHEDIKQTDTMKLDSIVSAYRNLVTSDYGTAGNSIFMVIYGQEVKKLSLKPSDIYKRAGILFPNDKQKFRSQELSQAFNMYDYFCDHPDKMRLPGIPAKPNYGGKTSTIKATLQQIYYGAPGTGKSNAIKEMTGEKGNGEGRMFAKDFTFRTTFHPDSDYASFVGAYKPVWDGNQIIYTFRPQTFLKAYVAAWLNPDENVALVVEEINRGNCAQIFGDIFQLLDREDRQAGAIGLSKYPIEADIDMQEFLHSSFHKKGRDKNGNEVEELLINDVDKDVLNSYYDAHYDDAFDKIVNGEVLTLPKNLSILATMNTSDQSLFPMDSAFKRRWEWIYQGIVQGKQEDGKTPLGWQIKIDEMNTVDWWKFVRSINEVIANLTTSEDKQLGYFFCMPDDEDGKTISAKRFVGKVIFYLWNDIFKDYAFEPDCCKGKDKEGKDKEVLYAKFYDEKDGKTIDTAVLKHFFETLKDPDDEKQSLLKLVEETKSEEPELKEGETQAEKPVEKSL